MAYLTSYQRETIEGKVEEYINEKLSDYVNEIDINNILDRMDIEEKLDLIIESYIEEILDDVIKRMC